MSTPSIQQLIADSLLQNFSDVIIKKIDTDNYLDIHVPSIHPKKGTHIFFNTSKQKIKIGFYCREEEFVQQALAKGGGLVEKYSQGVRLTNNPEFADVETAIAATLKFMEVLIQKSTPSGGARQQKTETYTFKKAVDAYLKGDLAYVAAYVQAGNPVLQFNGDILITNELISYISASTGVDRRIVDLVEVGVDLDASFDDGEGYTAVHYAAWDGKDEILAYLLEAGAQGDVVGEDGYTPLFLAAAGGHLDCVELLVENGVDVNRRLKDDNIYFSKQGGTPLTVAFINGFLGMALFLIDSGADPVVLKEPCKNAPSPDLFVNFSSMVKQGAINLPLEGQLEKILSLVGKDGEESDEEVAEGSGSLDLNDFLAELEADTSEEESKEDEEETETEKPEAVLDLASFLESMELEEDSDADESEEEEDASEESEEEEEDSDEDEELGYPMIAWWGQDIDTEKLDKYAYKWQTKSEVYGWVGGISGFIPEWFEDLSTDEICPSFSPKELLGIANRVANEKIIPVLSYAPEELFFHVKRVWWIVPFCIWKEDIASFVFIDKNGFYSMFKNKEGEVAINAIFPWDRVSDLEFETEYAGDANVNRLTLHQENGGFLTFDEFVGVGDDGELKGSYLAVVESIWLARKDTIEASKGESMWFEGKGGEGFKEFKKPQDLLQDSKWKNPSRPDPSMFGG